MPSNLILLNKKEKQKWMNSRMKKGYQFRFCKGICLGENVNVSIVCVETGEEFYLRWGQNLSIEV